MNIRKVQQNQYNKEKTKYVAIYFGTFLILTVIYLIFFKVELVNGISMNPTLYDKDVEISINRLYTKINRGDIVNIESSALGENIVKRVIGVGGDSIYCNHGIIIVNGEELNEDYILDPDEFEDSFKIEVPKSQVFVMGDNRGNSIDSRKIGTIPITEVKGKLLFHVGKVDE